MQQPQQHIESRPAFDEQPPPYARVVSRVYTRSLSPVVLFLTTCASIWALLVGVSYIRDRNDTGETSKLKMADTVIAVLCFLAFATEAFGFVAAFTRRLSLAKTYLALTFVNLVLFTAIGILKIVFTAAFKTDWKNKCITNNTGDLNSDGTSATDAEIASYCNSRHSREVIYDVIWLIALIIFGLVSLSINSAFYHQTKNPANSRLAPSTAYRMNPFAHQAPIPLEDPPFAAPSRPPPDYKNEPPSYNVGSYTGDLAEKDAQELSSNTFNDYGYATRQHDNESDSTLRGVDLDDNYARTQHSARV